MYNKDIILIKQMLLTIERIFEYTEKINNPDDFSDDYKTFDATLMNFIALAEIVGKISEQYRNLNSFVEWRKIYAFRNIIAHDYFGIDEEDVFDIIKNHLPILKKELEKLLIS